jgi:hypothetical protein
MVATLLEKRIEPYEIVRNITRVRADEFPLSFEGYLDDSYSKN